MGKVCIIAEAGVNHNGSVETAKQLIDEAADAGADVVKFQTFKAEKYISECAEKAQYQLQQTDKLQSQVAMMKSLELSKDEFTTLVKHCEKRNIEFLSTPFEVESVDTLLSIGVSRIKIPSGEINNAPLLLKAAKTGLDIILSTGMATLDEVLDGLGVLSFGYQGLENPCAKNFREAGSSVEGKALLRDKVVVLHCTTEYPAPFEDVNLNAMATLREATGLPIGYSDHTKGISVPIAAAAMGALVIEKHFTLDKNADGPDHQASIEPEELKAMVKSIREIELALGDGGKAPSKSEIKNIAIARKSLVAAQDITGGDLFTIENLTTKRPGSGANPYYYFDMLGRNASKDYQADELIGDECE